MTGNQLVPVINITWTIEANAGAFAIEGTMIKLLDQTTNQSLCVKYAFKINKSLNSENDKWMFSLDGAVVDPAHSYQLTVFHLPEPDQGHYRITKQITVPRCNDWRIQKAQICLENGSLWNPQMTVSIIWRTLTATVTVCFNTSEFSKVYQVSVYYFSTNVFKVKTTSPNVTFELDKRQFPKCEIWFVVQPFFTGCKNECLCFKKRLENCPYNSKQIIPYALIIEASLVLFMICGYLSCSRWKTSPKVDPATVSSFDINAEGIKVPERMRVLILYSPDHPLYTVIVLKFCAFLLARCGTDVVLDLLDSARLGQLGSIQWLDWHCEQIQSDKILILCSQGVQAKWRAMCGAKQVLLGEDSRSPMGDMLSPALCFIVPHFIRPVSFQRYIVAYFEDVCSEEDIPSPFNVTVRYKLMEQFEEVFFRILEMEKHGPGRVNHVVGLAEHDYPLCPSGEALRDALEAFAAYQREHPDWFQEQLVKDSEVDIGQTDHKY